MRVEGQGMAVDYVPAKAQAAKPAAEVAEVKDTPAKIRLDALTVPRKETFETNEIEELAQTLNDVMKMANCHLEFQPYEDSGCYQVKVVDSRTDDVIKEIPPDYMLDLSMRMREAINKTVGLFVDDLG